MGNQSDSRADVPGITPRNFKMELSVGVGFVPNISYEQNMAMNLKFIGILF